MFRERGILIRQGLRGYDVIAQGTEHGSMRDVIVERTRVGAVYIVSGRQKKREIDQNSMLIEERRQHVLATINRDGRVLVSELSDALGISRITIRKDLAYLEERGMLQRTHGGALSPQSGALLDPTLNEKAQHRLQHHWINQVLV